MRKDQSPRRPCCGPKAAVIFVRKCAPRGEYARRHGHTAPVVHGLQVFAFTAPGATLFPQYIGDVFVAFISASCKFLKEVNAGDTLYPALEIIALTPQGDTGIVTTRATVHNQRGELVLDGEHQYSLKTSPRDGK